MGTFHVLTEPHLLRIVGKIWGWGGGLPAAHCLLYIMRMRMRMRKFNEPFSHRLLLHGTY